MGFNEFFGITKPPKIKVVMDGKQYLDHLKYKESIKKKKILTKKQKDGVMILGLCVLGIIFASLLIYKMTYVPPETTSTLSRWFSMIPTLFQLSWSDLGKVLVLFAAPWLLVAVSIAWIFHGVQLRLLG